MFDKVYLGNTLINKIYLGDTLIKYNISYPTTNLSSVMVDGEIKILNGDGQIVRSVPIVAYKVIIDSEQNLYCCTDNTICKYDANNKKLYEIPASKTKVGAAFRESTNTLIVFENDKIQFIDVKSNLIMKYPFTHSLDALDISYKSDFFAGSHGVASDKISTFNFNGNTTVDMKTFSKSPIYSIFIDENEIIHHDSDSSSYRPYKDVHFKQIPPYNKYEVYYTQIGGHTGWGFNGYNGLIIGRERTMLYALDETIKDQVAMKNLSIATTNYVSVDVDDNGDFYCFFTENGKYIKIDGKTGDILWEKLNCATDYLAYVQKTK